MRVKTPPIRMSMDHIYWTFSAAAQCISALVAVLFTGYAIVHTLMETARERDDSLEEVHAALRESYHRRLTMLAALNTGAIIASLLVVYLNGATSSALGPTIIAVAAIDCFAVYGDLVFVVAIVNPRKFQKAAARALQRPRRAVADGTATAREFFNAFLHLERLVRDHLRAKGLYEQGRGGARMSFSFRQMVEALLQNERIDRSLFDELMSINSHRNLVFHGHVDRADPGMVRRAQAAAERIEKLA